MEDTSYKLKLESGGNCLQIEVLFSSNTIKAESLYLTFNWSGFCVMCPDKKRLVCADMHKHCMKHITKCG